MKVNKINKISKERIVAIVKGSTPPPSSASAEAVADRVIHAFEPLYQELDRKEKRINELLKAEKKKKKPEKKKRLGVI